MGNFDVLQKNINEVLNRQANSTGLFKPKIAITLRMCTVAGKPYQSLYVQQPSGLYRYMESKTIDSLPGAKGTAREDERFVVEAGRIEICPWCGCGSKRFPGLDTDTNLVYCDGCNFFVCVGKSYGSLFRCWCGEQGYLGGGVSMSGAIFGQAGSPVVETPRGKPVNAVPPLRPMLGNGRK